MRRAQPWNTEESEGNMSSVIYPRDFFERQVRMDPKLCFVLSPFKAKYEGIRKAVDAIVTQCGFKAVHAKDIQQPGIIHADIWDHIQRAAVIIADVTEYNPNVFFELGVAAAVKDKSRLIMVRESTCDDTFPFDISVFRYISYENSIPDSLEFAENLKAFLSNIQAEDDFLQKIHARMHDWEKMEYEYDVLLRVTDLKLLKKRTGEEVPDGTICAYAFASSMYHKCDCKFWTDLNKDNALVIAPVIHLICGRYVRPSFRAAYALQFMAERIIKDCTDSISRKIADKEISSRLTNAIVQLEIPKFVREEAGKYVPMAESMMLLTDFTRWELL